MYEDGIYAMEPIRFTNIDYIGQIGRDWIFTEYNLSKVITQNILYAAYHSAKTIDEIADLLGVHESLIVEEVNFLEETGFMIRKEDEKYLTTVLISDFSKEVYEERHEIFTKYAKVVCDKYIPLLLDVASAFMRSMSSQAQSPLSTNIYVPQNDPNFLLWSLISFACSHKLTLPELKENISKHCIKRIDGGENIVYTSIEKEHFSDHNEAIYKTFGEETIAINIREILPLQIWQYNTYYDSRKIDWSRALREDLVNLFRFVKGKISYDPANVNVFDVMFKKGYLASKDTKSTPNKGVYVNMIIANMTKDELINLLPPMPDEFIALNKELGDEIYKISKSQYPPHTHDLFHSLCQNDISCNEMKTRILEKSLKMGILKPLSEKQKKTVNMIMFCPKEIM